MLPCIRARYLMIRLVNPLEGGKLKDGPAKILMDMSKEDDYGYPYQDYNRVIENIHGQDLSGISDV